MPTSSPSSASRSASPSPPPPHPRAMPRPALSWRRLRREGPPRGQACVPETCCVPGPRSTRQRSRGESSTARSTRHSTSPRSKRPRRPSRPSSSPAFVTVVHSRPHWRPASGASGSGPCWKGRCCAPTRTRARGFHGRTSREASPSSARRLVRPVPATSHRSPPGSWPRLPRLLPQRSAGPRHWKPGPRPRRKRARMRNGHRLRKQRGSRWAPAIWRAPKARCGKHLGSGGGCLGWSWPWLRTSTRSGPWLSNEASWRRRRRCTAKPWPSRCQSSPRTSCAPRAWLSSPSSVPPVRRRWQRPLESGPSSSASALPPNHKAWRRA